MKYDRSILIGNIKKLMRNNNISQATLSEALSKSIPLSQGRISLCLNENKSDNFTIEQIVAIADYFKVSIDSMLGIQTQETEKDLTCRDICKSIARIIKCTNTHICKCENDIFQNHYEYALSFPKSHMLSAFQQGHYINTHIDKFLERIKDLNEIQAKGNLNFEMYDRLVESYLNDVPEDYWMDEFSIMSEYPKDEPLPFPD